MKVFIKDFFSKCDEIRRKLRIWSQLLKKSSIKNFIFFFCSQNELKIIFSMHLLAGNALSKIEWNTLPFFFLVLQKIFLEAFTVFRRLLEKLHSAKKLEREFLPEVLPLMWRQERANLSKLQRHLSKAIWKIVLVKVLVDPEIYVTKRKYSIQA